MSCTLATARRITVTAATALLPSALAAICAAPARIAVTSPDADTRATVVSLLDQNTVRSSSGRATSSNTRAWSAVLLPSTSESVAGVTDTDPTGASTGVGAVMSETPAHACSTTSIGSSENHHDSHRDRRCRERPAGDAARSNTQRDPITTRVGRER